MGVLRYLAACALAGGLIGRAFGVFARASFHWPHRLDQTPYWHQALVRALDAVEFPSLFALTLAAALGLWIGLRPKAIPPLPPRGWRVPTTLGVLLAAVAVLIAVPATKAPGGPLSGMVAAAMGALAAALLVRLWGEAGAAPGGFWRRLLAQLPLIGGGLLATSFASAFLGYRGGSSLIHAFALAIGIGLAIAELGLAVPIAAVAARRARHR